MGGTRNCNYLIKIYIFDIPNRVKKHNLSHHFWDPQSFQMQLLDRDLMLLVDGILLMSLAHDSEPHMPWC